MLNAQGPQTREEARRGDAHSAAALDGLDDDGAGALGWVSLEQATHGSQGIIQPTRLRGPRGDACVGVELRGERAAEALRVAAQRQRPVGEAVVAPFETDDSGAARGERGRLEGSLDGVAAGQAQDHARLAPGTERGEPLEQRDLHVRGVDVAEPVQQLLGLRGDRAHHARVSMADRRDPEAAREVHVDVAVRVFDVRADGRRPDDGVGGGSTLLGTASAARGESRALGAREGFDPGQAAWSRDGGVDARETLPVGGVVAVAGRGFPRGSRVAGRRHVGLTA